MPDLIREQDLVVSTCTVWPNLSATLGVPTWLLTIHTPNWRWGLGDRGSIWYPGVLEHLRQEAEGDWSCPVREVMAGVGKLIGG